MKERLTVKHMRLNLLLLLVFFIFPSSSMAIYLIEGSAQYEYGASVQWSVTIEALDTCTPYCGTERVDHTKITLNSFDWNYLPSWMQGAESAPIVDREYSGFSIFDDNSNLLDGFGWSLSDVVWHSVKFDYSSDVYDLYGGYQFRDDMFRVFDGYSTQPSDLGFPLQSPTTTIQALNASIPEPSTILLLGAGLLGLGIGRYKFKRKDCLP